jgi:Cd2+/Zn2+-exporting ATPase
MNKAYINVHVGEIECTGCVADIETVLLNLDGILESKVSYASEMIHVGYDPDIVNERQILSAIGKMGFKARVSE